MGRRLILAILAIFLGVPLAHAEKLYKWVDQDGNVSYHDRPPFQAGYRVEEKDLGNRKSSTARTAQDIAERFPVVLYSAPECGSCDNARAYLKSRGIPFTEKNVKGNRKLQAELLKTAGALAVPTITVGDKIMKGYLRSLLEGELDDVGYPKAKATGKREPEEQSASPEEQTEEQEQGPTS
jgi:glutaredoxin